MDEGEEGGAVGVCEKAVCVVGLETGGGDERTSGEIRVGEEEEHVLVVHGKSHPDPDRPAACGTTLLVREHNRDDDDDGDEDDEDSDEHKGRPTSIRATPLHRETVDRLAPAAVRLARLRGHAPSRPSPASHHPASTLFPRAAPRLLSPTHSSPRPIHHLPLFPPLLSRTARARCRPTRRTKGPLPLR